jgi:hypothetical protein
MFVGWLTRFHHLGPWPLSRDLNIQFPWKVFIHVAEVHIWLAVHENLLFRLSWPPNGNPRKASHLRHFWVFGSLQQLHVPYRGFCLGPRTFFGGHYLEFHTYNAHGNCFYVWLYFISFLRSWNTDQIIVFTFERYIRAKVVTYRLDVVFGFLHTQQLRRFDEPRNDQGIIQDRSAKINTMATSLYLPASYFIFRILRLAKKNERMENGTNRGFWPFLWRWRWSE